jgi:hypothetical protein
MLKINWIICILFISGTVGCVNTPFNNEFDILAEKVVALNIVRHQYTLAKKLTEDQKKLARQNAVKDASPGTYKFNDKNLFVIAEKNSDRVLILYEHFEKASKSKGHELIGTLVMEFGDPTVFAHGKTVYWAYNVGGKISEIEFSNAKGASEQLEILATIKLESSELLMGKDDDKKNESEQHAKKKGAQSVYYVISSEPLLKLLKAQVE